MQMNDNQLVDEIRSIAAASNLKPSSYFTPGGEELMMISAQYWLMLYKELVKRGVIKQGEDLPGEIALVNMPNHDGYFLLFKKQPNE